MVSRTRNENGFVLFATLAFLLALSSILIVIVQNSNSLTQYSSRYLQESQSRHALEGIGRLLSLNAPKVLARTDCRYGEFNVSLTSYSPLDINSASKDELIIGGVALGFNTTEAAAFAELVVDYRDMDVWQTNGSTELQPYKEKLLNIVPKNGLFLTLEELMRIPISWGEKQYQLANFFSVDSNALLFSSSERHPAPHRSIAYLVSMSHNSKDKLEFYSVSMGDHYSTTYKKIWSSPVAEKYVQKAHSTTLKNCEEAL